VSERSERPNKDAQASFVVTLTISHSLTSLAFYSGADKKSKVTLELKCLERVSVLELVSVVEDKANGASNDWLKERIEDRLKAKKKLNVAQTKLTTNLTNFYIKQAVDKNSMAEKQLWVHQRAFQFKKEDTEKDKREKLWASYTLISDCDRKSGRDAKKGEEVSERSERPNKDVP